MFYSIYPWIDFISGRSVVTATHAVKHVYQPLRVLYPTISGNDNAIRIYDTRTISSAMFRRSVSYFFLAGSNHSYC